MQPFQETHPDKADEDQIDRDNEIQEPGHDEDQDARDQGDDGRNVGGGDDHCNFSGVLRNRVVRAELYIAFSNDMGTGSRNENASNERRGLWNRRRACICPSSAMPREICLKMPRMRQRLAQS
jgi:hypothetical protein